MSAIPPLSPSRRTLPDSLVEEYVNGLVTKIVQIDPSKIILTGQEFFPDTNAFRLQFDILPSDKGVMAIGNAVRKMFNALHFHCSGYHPTTNRSCDRTETFKSCKDPLCEQGSPQRRSSSCVGGGGGPDKKRWLRVEIGLPQRWRLEDSGFFGEIEEKKG